MERIGWACLLVASIGCVRWGVPDELSDDSTETGPIPDMGSQTETETETETGEEFEWPPQSPLGAGARLVVWGKTGIPTTNLGMFENIFVNLGGAATDLTILWISECDPRLDPAGCLLGNLDPFFAMVDLLGTIEFATPSTVDPLAYDVVVADFCGPVVGEHVTTMLGEGARVLVLGDPWCQTPTGPSSDRANEVLEYFGTRMHGPVLTNHAFLVPEPDQVVLLTDVTEIDAWGVALQEFIAPVVSSAATFDGSLLTSRDP